MRLNAIVELLNCIFQIYENIQDKYIMQGYDKILM